jgi:hypothetical protein
LTIKPPIKRHGGILIAEGDLYEIIAAMIGEDSCPFWDYYQDLKKKYEKILEKGGSQNNKICKDYNTLARYFGKFVDHGHWPNETQLGNLDDGFFEFKNVDTGLRVPFYYDKRNRKVVILTHYFEKKSQKTPPKEISRMKAIKTSFEIERSQGGSRYE